MSLSAGSCVLTDMTWVDVEAHLTRESRLIVPVGTCDQFGPHLPIGAGTMVTEAIASELSRDFAILRAPTLAFGVNLPAERCYPGTATLAAKTLHRVLNDLIASWEDHGFTEFILLTAQRHEPHIDALATVTSATSRVRLVEILGIDFSSFLTGPPGPEHGGEVLTSLMLHLYPEKVNLTRAQDYRPPSKGGSPPRRLARLPLKAPGAVGDPTLATAEKGRSIYEHILQKVRTKVFLVAEDADET